MAWIIALAFFGFLVWRARRAHQQAVELAAAGALRSPLYWISNALVAVPLALVMYMAATHQQSPVPAILWFAAIATMVALLVLRRALKWRYPI